MSNPNQITCVVKGDRIQALHAADNRGVHFVVGTILTETDGQTVGKVHNSQFDRVVKWFLEDNNRENGGDGPYPVGTLLYYSESIPNKSLNFRL